jgi:hypothetical protein
LNSDVLNLVQPPVEETPSEPVGVGGITKRKGGVLKEAAKPRLKLRERERSLCMLVLLLLGRKRQLQDEGLDKVGA